MSRLTFRRGSLIRLNLSKQSWVLQTRSQALTRSRAPNCSRENASSTKANRSKRPWPQGPLVGARSTPRSRRSTAGHSVPSIEWRREFSLLLGLERLLSEEEPHLVDGTVLSAHQVDALSGTLTALLADAQRDQQRQRRRQRQRAATAATATTRRRHAGERLDRAATPRPSATAPPRRRRARRRRRRRTGRKPTRTTSPSSTRSPRTGRTPRTATASTRSSPRIPTRTSASGSSTRPAPVRPSRRSASSRPAAPAAC